MVTRFPPENLHLYLMTQKDDLVIVSMAEWTEKGGEFIEVALPLGPGCPDEIRIKRFCYSQSFTLL
jgi:hypothetical protein